MKKRCEQLKLPHPGILPAMIMLSLLLVLPFCTKDEERRLIPENSFSDILYEVYLANGLIIDPDVRNMFADRDSAGNYYDIIENHGFTVEQMDNTLRYYYSKKPKKLIRMYDQAIGKMAEMESIIHQDYSEERLSRDDNDLWDREKDYYLPDTTGNITLCFDFRFDSPGVYLFSHSAVVHPDDQTYNPHFQAFTYHADSLGTGKINYLPQIKYLKDGQSRDYHTTIRIEKNEPVILRVSLYAHDNNPEHKVIHAEITGISLLMTHI